MSETPVFGPLRRGIGTLGSPASLVSHGSRPRIARAVADHSGPVQPGAAMPLMENAWREITRSTISKPKYRVAVTVACDDVLPEDGEAWLYVNVQWSLEPGEEGPAVMEDPYAVRLRLAGASDAVASRIVFPDHTEGLALQGNQRRLVRMRAGAVSGSGADQRLVVELEGEDPRRLPLRIGTPGARLTVRPAEGDALPRSLRPGQGLGVQAERQPASEGRLRWYSAPAGGLTIDGDLWSAEISVALERRLDRARYLVAAWGPPRANGGQPPGSRGPTDPALTESCIAVHCFEPQCQVDLRVADQPLRDAWVAWREGDTLRRLWCDHDGNLKALRDGGDAEAPWDYGDDFHAQADSTVHIHHHRGARPLPMAVLVDEAHAGAFVERSVTIATPGQGPGQRATAAIELPAVAAELIEPRELALWTLTRGPYADPYLTDGLQQGAAAFNGNDPQLTEFDPAPALAPAAPARPREHGLLVRVRVPADVTAAHLQVHRSDGTAVPLLRGLAANANRVTRLPIALAAPQGETRSAEAVVAFAVAGGDADVPPAFGTLHLAVHAERDPLALLLGYTVLLCGLQAGLVDDREAAADGRRRGPWRGETDDRVIMDWTESPRNGINNLKASFRVRRMARFAFANATRPLDPTQAGGPANPDILQPQMPLWMGELALVGCSGAALRLLLRRRLWRRGLGQDRPPRHEETDVAFRWQWRLSWHGPDAGSINAPLAQNNTHWYEGAWTGQVAARLRVDIQGRWVRADDGVVEVGDDGIVAEALHPAPAQPLFPVANRRLPGLVVNTVQRPWGRRAGAPMQPAALVEFQPLVTINGNEAIRGGNGNLTIDQVQIGGAALGSRRRVEGDAWQDLPQPVTVALPTVRVVGTNPPDNNAVMRPIVDALVQRYYGGHNVQSVRILTLAQWQATAWEVFVHESSGQHYNLDWDYIQRRRGTNDYFGRQRGMPLFGQPHGYGFGQLDTPRPSDDQVWSWLENIDSAVTLLMGAKATIAYNHINAHPPADNRRFQALVQREAVRGYNGGLEFIWSGGAWRIDPNLRDWQNPADHARGPYRNLRYPNGILGTDIRYWEPWPAGDGAATMFPRPIDFDAADYGPGI